MAFFFLSVQKIAMFVYYCLPVNAVSEYKHREHKTNLTGSGVAISYHVLV